MMKTVAGLTVLAALVAACDSTTTGPHRFAGTAAGPSAATSTISMMPALATAGSEITFTNFGLFDSDRYTRTWDFGDGATAEGPLVKHVYQDPGTYEVRLVGCDGAETHSATMTVNVAPAGSGTRPPLPEVRQP
jgi:PKD repeat protein